MTQHFRVDAGDPCFEGHFPGFPVYPAVAQLSLLTEAVSRMLGMPCTISALPSVKFLHPVSPDSLLEIELMPGSENSAAFTIFCAGQTVAKGRLTYRMTFA